MSDITPPAKSDRATERLRRILALVPYLANQPGIGVSEACQHFGVDRKTLLADLELVWMCGLPPYSPDEMFEIDIDDDAIVVRNVDPLAVPLALRRVDAVRMLASGKAALALPGMDETPLGSAVVKLESALGEDAVGIALDGGTDERLRTMNRAIAERKVLHLRYLSIGRDVETTRDIEPARLFFQDGHWYLVGQCRSAGAQRTFRVDRVRELALLDETFPTTAPVALHSYTPTADDLRATIVLDPAARWVVERYPVESERLLDDGRIEIEIGAPSDGFLVRLLLSLGAAAAVLRPPRLRDALAERAAGVLRLYEE